jgi:hypothetical protein
MRLAKRLARFCRGTERVNELRKRQLIAITAPLDADKCLELLVERS